MPEDPMSNASDEVLEVVSTSLGTPFELQPPPDSLQPEAEPPQGRIPVSIEIANRSSDTIYVWSELRRFIYDANSRTLRLDLADVTGPPDQPDIIALPRHPRLPSQLSVPPGERRTLQVDVPTVLRRVRFDSPESGGEVEETEVGPVDQVEVRIAYADAPLEVPHDQPTTELLENIRSWGAEVQATVAPTGRSGRSRRPRRRQE
jgi:hypothetical protein